MSLSRHLTSPAAEHGRLAFHPDCPRCQSERLAGELAGDELISRRTQAVLAAGLIAFSAAGPPTAALSQEPAQQQEGTTDPGGEPPELAPDFDPGGDDGGGVEIAPLAGGDQAGGQEDDGEGPPVEAEDPPSDSLPELPIAPEPTLAAPAPPTAEPQTAPAPAPPPATAPAPAPLAEPLAQPEALETTREASKPKPSKPAPQRRQRPRTPAQEAPAPVAAPVPTSPAPAATTAAAPPAPTESVVVSESELPVRGASYTVQQGDSLWSIARTLMGSAASNGQLAREVARLWGLNEQRIGTGDPNMLHVGTVLRLR